MRIIIEIPDELLKNNLKITTDNPGQQHLPADETLPELATEKQRNYMNELGIDWDPQTTKKQASEKIDQHLKKQQQEPD